MNALLGLAIFVALALVGWGLAELKSKVFTYHNDEEKEKVDHHCSDEINPELGIKDVINNISAKGFDAN